MLPAMPLLQEVMAEQEPPEETAAHLPEHLPQVSLLLLAQPAQQVAQPIPEV